jgi:hypothetical protein
VRIAAAAVALVAWSAAAQAPAPTQGQLNDIVRQALASEGDDGRAVREVMHWVRPLPGARRASEDAVAQYLAENGFQIVDTSRDAVVFRHRVAVAGRAFDRTTEQLDAYMVPFGWFYDGWETEVVRR